MEDDYIQDFAETEDAYYEDTMDQDNDTAWETYEAEDNIEETYYQADDFQDYDGAMEEAYAAYLDARRQFANLRAARGYYPVVALAPDAAGGGAPSQLPVSPGGKSKSKGKGKKKGFSSKGKGRNANPPQKGSIPSRTSAFFGGSATCFVCGKAGHLAAQCPNGSPTSKGNSSTSSPSKRPKTAGSERLVWNTGWWSLQHGDWAQHLDEGH